MDGLEFIQINKSKCKKKPYKPTNAVPLSNRFEDLEEEPVLQADLKNNPEAKSMKKRKTKSNKRRKTVVINQTTDSHLIKENEQCLFKFETENQFQTLTEIPDESMNIIIQTPKHKLKKCRFCNFKKRSCLINPEGCQAKNKFCWNCKNGTLHTVTQLQEKKDI